jgi:hypothetical protein
VDLACDMRSYDYFHSDDPVEAAKSGQLDLPEGACRCPDLAMSGPGNARNRSG